MDIESLAIFGGTPKFPEQLHVGRPNLLQRELFLKRVNDILDRKWLTNNGPYVREFEEKIANYVGCSHCIVLCNGTVALEVLIRALGLNGEVIVPAFTFIATAHALGWLGISPVFCDIKFQTYNIDLARIEEIITPKTTGIIGVHVWGQPCQVDGLEDLAKRHDLKLIFDAAHAFGCSYKGQMVGNFGDAEVFSFHATKYINTAEGGAILTNNDELAKTARQMRDFGYSTNNKIETIGTNGKMNEISAAMGVTMLDGVTDLIEKNLRNYKQYQNELSELSGVDLIFYDEVENHNFQYIVLDIDADITGIHRDQIQKILFAENVLARSYFNPSCHKTEPYLASFLATGRSLPHTESASDQTLCLPTGMDIKGSDISKICDIIKFSISNSQTIKKRLLI